MLLYFLCSLLSRCFLAVNGNPTNLNVETNRTIEKADWDPIIHIYKRKVAIEMYKIMKEEGEHRLGNVFKRLRIKEEKI